MNIEKLKFLLGNDPELNELTDKALTRGFLDEDCQPTQKGTTFSPSLKAYADGLMDPQFVMFKVEGINLENVELEIFDLIRDSVHSIIDMAWRDQKDAGYHVNRGEYENNVSLSLRSASFQVNIELPSVNKSAAKEKIDAMISAINDESDIMAIDKRNEKILNPIKRILSHPKITGIKMCTDRNIDPEDAPLIRIEKTLKIQHSLERYELNLQEIEPENIEFSENVLVFASDSEKRIFKGYASEMKVFNFDCAEPTNGDAWYHVINNQIASVDDLDTAVKVHVIGTMENSKKVKVSSVTITPQ